jgi:hypothetical protein
LEVVKYELLVRTNELILIMINFEKTRILDLLYNVLRPMFCFCQENISDNTLVIDYINWTAATLEESDLL